MNGFFKAFRVPVRVRYHNGFYLDDVILGPAKQPTEGKVFGNVIEECLEAFFSACCEDVRYTQSQEYFADFAENNEFEFYENGICIQHR